MEIYLLKRLTILNEIRVHSRIIENESGINQFLHLSVFWYEGLFIKSYPPIINEKEVTFPFPLGVIFVARRRKWNLIYSLIFPMLPCFVVG